MPIKTVVSYKNAWKLFLDSYPEEYQEILQSISTGGWKGIEQIINDYQQSNFLVKARMISKARLSNLSIKKYKGFIDSLRKLSWTENEEYEFLVISKNNIYIFLPNDLNLNPNVYKWLFNDVEKITINNNLAFPILITDSKNNLESLTSLQSINKNYPFLVLYVTSNDDDELSVIELEETEKLKDSIILDKFIEFPPEYYQAGLGILNYFSQYLHKNYPDENATVKIEQNGQSIRLVVISEDGNTDVIERALTEYEMIVTGNGNPEDFTEDKELILELKSELRMSQVRIDTQQDIIGYLKNDKNNLSELLEKALKQEKYTTIEINPSFRNNLSVVTNNVVNEALPLVEQLKYILPDKNDTYAELESLQASLREVIDEKDPEKIKNSKPMEKFRKFIEGVNKGNDGVSEAIKTSESAIETFMKLAGKYNKIAEWCGMPVVPSAFTK